MKSRNVTKITLLCEYIAEKFLEWAEYIFYLFKNRREWRSNLTEHYLIYKKHRHKAFVEEFLKERERILSLNRYKMEIKEIDKECDDNNIGKVQLCRKKKIIAQAMLKTKKDDSDNCKLIYWSFDKEEII